MGVTFGRARTMGRGPMTVFRLFAAIGLAASLMACSAPSIASRNAPFEAVPPAMAVVPAVAVPDAPQRPQIAPVALRIVDYEVRVPADLTVSEANLYYPIADIVWRGDPAGNRKAQVAHLFEQGVRTAQSRLDGPRGVKVEIVLQRFHSVTEKTRYTVGGVHDMKFLLTVRDAETGEVLVDDRLVRADLKAFGGRRALEAEAQGQTMKVRLTGFLARVIAAELTLPGGWRDFDRRMADAVDAI